MYKTHVYPRHKQSSKGEPSPSKKLNMKKTVTFLMTADQGRGTPGFSRNTHMPVDTKVLGTEKLAMG